MEFEEDLFWLGHASFYVRSRDGLNLYFDPWKVGPGWPKADFVFISHHHHDHCSREAVDTLARQGTRVVGNARSIEEVAGVSGVQYYVLDPGTRLQWEGLHLLTVPAYNRNKFREPGLPYHPREEQHLGFVVFVDGQTLYHAGDTDLVPDEVPRGVNLALLPVSGTYVMTAQEAVQAARVLQPDLLVPMHYGDIVGSVEDAEYVKEHWTGETRVLEPLDSYPGEPGSASGGAVSVTGINHISVVVDDVDRAVEHFSRLLDARLREKEEYDEFNVTVAHMDWFGTELALEEPHSEEGPFGQFLAKHGPGFNHLALDVKNLESLVRRLEEKGVRLVGKDLTGEGRKEAIVHPKDNFGLMLQLIEEA